MKLKRAFDPVEVARRWKLYQMPDSLAGQSFLDVGCWGGQFCMEALGRGATTALGVDVVWDDGWEAMLEDNPMLSFRCLDALSPGFRYLPVHDVVLCAGLLYHVTDPVGLLTNLKNRTMELLILESAYREGGQKNPALFYCSNDSYGGDWSNWFVPNEAFLREITKELGLKVEKMFGVGTNRICLHLVPLYKVSKKISPRNPKLM